jgi:hypothetical protein
MSVERLPDDSELVFDDEAAEADRNAEDDDNCI